MADYLNFISVSKVSSTLKNLNHVKRIQNIPDTSYKIKFSTKFIIFYILFY